MKGAGPDGVPILQKCHCLQVEWLEWDELKLNQNRWAEAEWKKAPLTLASLLTWYQKYNCYRIVTKQF